MNKWQKMVKKHAGLNKGKSLREILPLAKAEYRKTRGKKATVHRGTVHKKRHRRRHRHRHKQRGGGGSCQHDGVSGGGQQDGVSGGGQYDGVSGPSSGGSGVVHPSSADDLTSQPAQFGGSDNLSGGKRIRRSAGKRRSGKRRSAGKRRSSRKH